ncbi:dihydrofolate reductase family protein [Mameliella alba]|nr:dihydrofolate reductase family protein [Mameliella alba]MBY6170195.1 dihydrofolate reductase family protein [Mameliella alba]MBY6175214.1 dihydrofolate reductase family protein [Mameliella alba]
MTTGHVFIAMSLDGFIAREDDSLDWLMAYHAPDEDHGFDAFMASVDGLVMGSGTFRTVLGFGGDWPYSKPVIVLSRSMTEDDIPDPLKGRVRLSRLSPPELMSELSQQGWQRVYVDGGSVIRSFLAAGLIADMELTIVPVLIGKGRRLFGDMDLKTDIGLTLERVRRYPSGLALTRYSVSPSLSED